MTKMIKLFVVFFIAGWAALPTSAAAQYVDYRTPTANRPSVIINMDALEDEPTIAAPERDLPALSPPPVVERRTLPPQKFLPKKTKPEKLLKPVFTAPTVEPVINIAPPASIKSTRRTLEPDIVAAPPERKITAAPAVVPSLKDLTLTFIDNSSDITGTLEERLRAVIGQMKNAPGTRLQVRAYASGKDGSKSSARRISLSRALSVRAYMMDNGIKPTRVDVRALGTETDRAPLDRVDLVFVR